ncbi:Uu.00g047460.m01.CDS01 [Anthostomella pinea]|uniref:NEDD8-activating enzyme E1 regulatory subunit n=1 Tax=Anthostomella pinea TaxID=933095 RepID=A0AAI8V6I1_9PEZI|nr:Uu.00g047460.m01.CDS01 [Anthostomella pinea]
MTEIVVSQTPPMLHGPTEKEKKYDRQLRLWAASGQAALESANILLVNSGAGTVGVETLKNLVLPGIGKFTIADDALVNEADLGVNFFLDESSLGRLRSECCTKLLQELNPEVQGDWFPKEKGPLDLANVLETSPIFTLIIYTNPIRKEDLATIEAYSSQHRTPVISIHSAGFYSYFRIALPGTFPIVDTHPEVEKTADLRLLNPWPELVEFAKEMTRNIDALDDHEHGHVPYVVILLHYLEQWRQSHSGENPNGFKDKTEFGKLVTRGARTNNPEGGEENFQEAVAAINKNIKAPELEAGVEEVFNHQVSDEAELESMFWVIARAIKQFYHKHGCLPLPGALPDMKAQSSVYVKLQSIYKAKARKDAQEVLETVRASPGGKDVDPTEVDLFCKNARFVKLINAKPRQLNLSQVFDTEKASDEEAEAMKVATCGAFSLPASNFFIYLALTATAHNPAATAEEIVSTITNAVPEAAGHERLWQVAQEVARAGGGELHNISAITGGMVAQEMIKIITKQYIPIDDTCIFDGISSRCQVLRL